MSRQGLCELNFLVTQQHLQHLQQQQQQQAVHDAIGIADMAGGAVEDVYFT